MSCPSVQASAMSCLQPPMAPRDEMQGYIHELYKVPGTWAPLPWRVGREWGETTSSLHDHCPSATALATMPGWTYWDSVQLRGSLGIGQGGSGTWSCPGKTITCSPVAPKWVCTQTLLFVQDKTYPLLFWRKAKCLYSLVEQLFPGTTPLKSSALLQHKRFKA